MATIVTFVVAGIATFILGYPFAGGFCLFAAFCLALGDRISE